MFNVCPGGERACITLPDYGEIIVLVFCVSRMFGPKRLDSVSDLEFIVRGAAGFGHDIHAWLALCESIEDIILKAADKANPASNVNGDEDY